MVPLGKIVLTVNSDEPQSISDTILVTVLNKQGRIEQSSFAVHANVVTPVSVTPETVRLPRASDTGPVWSATVRVHLNDKRLIRTVAASCEGRGIKLVPATAGDTLSPFHAIDVEVENMAIPPEKALRGIERLIQFQITDDTGRIVKGSCRVIVSPHSRSE